MLVIQAELHAAAAAELGGGAVVDQCHRLQADLMNCQQVGLRVAGINNAFCMHA